MEHKIRHGVEEVVAELCSKSMYQQVLIEMSKEVEKLLPVNTDIFQLKKDI